MSYNGQRYLADRERLLEPDTVIITGTRKRYAEIKPVAYSKTLPNDEEAQDEYLESKGINIKPKS